MAMMRPRKRWGSTSATTGMACAMCHPMASDTHPNEFPKFQAQIGKYLDAPRHDQLVHREAEPGGED